jgi:uncharacterized protein YcsI (UPF0317 family)
VTLDGLARRTGAEVRALCRSGRWDGPTADAAHGYVQANLVILPEEAAGGFVDFCTLNPKPCPVLETTPPGDPQPKRTAPGADLRMDLPRYRVYEHGMCTSRPTSIERFWRDDLVAFLIGCSFTFDSLLLAEGLPVRHIEQGRNVPMYRTNIACAPGGTFCGPLVVSMRPMTPGDARRAAEVTERYPNVHGGPIAIGDAASLGIRQLDHPDYGDPVELREGEVPVFWACGVTPMEAVIHARCPLAIVHEPGHMFVTDRHVNELRNA